MCYRSFPIANSYILYLNPEATEPPTLDCRVIFCVEPPCDDPLPAPPGECCPVCPGATYVIALVKYINYKYIHYANTPQYN